MSQGSDAAVPLTDLCAICHVNPIKYTCPRDGIHTCSLPCVRRHKQWAQCSGVRDPAEYRKRSELATPASIDKDFNFITKVERSLARADDTVVNKGIDLVPARLRQHETRPKFEIEAELRNITIIKAPKGLSRSKQNRTYWGGQPKCIVWSVEWVCQDGHRLFSTAAETKSVKELFDHAVGGSRRNTRKRKQPSDGAEENLDELSQHVPSMRRKDGCRGTQMSVPSMDKSQPQPAQVGISDSVPSTLVDEAPRSTLNSEPDSRPDDSYRYFYLHRPNTESKYKCLIPLAATNSLQEELRNKTLIEFPTIHVRSEPAEQLQAPFITEEEYVKRHGVDIPINVSAPLESVVDDAAVEEGEVSSVEVLPILNETKVLEVLAKDLGG